jgi:hypothetical protein
MPDVPGGVKNEALIPLGPDGVLRSENPRSGLQGQVFATRFRAAQKPMPP